MYHNLFRIPLLVAALAIILAACGVSTPATAQVTQTSIATEVASTNTPKPTATSTEAPVVVSVPTQPPTMIALEVVTMTGDDGMVLVDVPSGEFTMGSDDGERDEKPIHTVTLDAFWIDQTEVTNKMYSLCVEAGVCKEPVYKSSTTHSSYYRNSEFDNYPVIYVDWSMAKAYCEWVDRRLPTEAEWEKAARGTDERTYPWGEEIDRTLANYDQKVGDTTIVGNYPNGDSPYGALDMAGNVAEWVNDWYDVYPGGDPSIVYDFGQTHRVARGASWYVDDYTVRSTYRGWAKPGETENDLGFRCASSP